MNFKKFENKYIIKGKLKVETALHIGSGKLEGDDDAAFIKTKDGYHYIPGSTFKGYLRNKVEKLVVNSPFGLKANGEVLNEGDVFGIFGYTSADTHKEVEERVEKILGGKYKNFASKIHISDLKINENTKEVTRDGIKISRKTGATIKGAKFDYNVIEEGNSFDLEIVLENVEKYQIELLMLGLKELKSGDLFGGKLSRGIGKCKLELNSCEYVDTSDKKALENYIFKGELKTKDITSLEKIEKITL